MKVSFHKSLSLEDEDWGPLINIVESPLIISGPMKYESRKASLKCKLSPCSHLSLQHSLKSHYGHCHPHSLGEAIHSWAAIAATASTS